MNPKPVGRKTPPSDSSISTWFGELIPIAVAVGDGRRASPFSSLVHSTTRTVRRGRRFSFFISRSASHVTTQPPPSSVEPVPTSHESKWPLDDHDFVGQLAAADLADDVGRVGVGEEVRLHLEPDPRRRAAVLHALQPVGVLDRDRGGRNLRLTLGVAERAGVRRAQAGRADGADERRNRAERRGA